VAGLQTEEQQIGNSMRTERTFAELVTFFAGIAAMLAAIGLYGVISWSVARRKAEFGIRMALGATGREVQFLVLRRSMLIAIPGVAAGMGAALALTRFIRSFLYEVKPTDPVVLATTAAALLAIAVVAAWTPAVAAAHIEPLDALRHE
jgi:ABC-type antimicrobial peptide transport system permease subunit